jgi:glutathione synthase/RimK-type ligase-like ATP-grasp enzyme
MTTRIGFLACPGTLPGSPVRRADAFEHDVQIEALRKGFTSAGLDLVEIDWHGEIETLAAFPLVLVGTVWDYQDHEAAFLTKLEELAARAVIVCNSAELVRWNSDKSYLRDLSAAGAPTIPTLWPDAPSGEDIAAAFDHFGCDRLVVKRRVGAGAEGQEIFSRENAPPAGWRYGHRAMVQPFLPAIVEEGEYSFVFIDGQFSHAIRKTAAAGDYRIQSLYGGKEEAIDPTPSDIAAAEAVIRTIPGEVPLYARIDMIRHDGALAVMEAEMIEPYLYPRQGPHLGQLMAEAVLRRLK